ncbi:MAG TPA: TonB-dependent receptor, partial [Erythrobacter sp.]|nr:TonB-dependent receptor [Erythrobacter sp.]
DSQLGLDREVYDANLTAEYLIGDSLTFTTVNGYREFDSHEVFDADGGPAPFLEFAEIAKGHQVSHEGRFTYVDPRWRAAFGWNFFTEDNLQRVPFSTEEGTFLQCLTTSLGLAPVIPGIPCVAADGSVPAAQVTQLATGGAATAIPYSSVFENQGNNQSYSLFADATFIPTTSLELTAGARLLIEQRRSGFVTSVPNSVLTGAPLIPGQIDTGGRTFEAEDSFSAVLPRFNALYRITPDLNVFATVSKGRRSPVVSLGARRAGTEVLPNINVIPQEVVWNYEGGIKFGSRTVSGSLGVYYQDYSNFQTTRTISDPNDPSGLPLGTTVTESVGSASNLGVEAEINIRPTSWLSVFANVGYIDGGIDDDPINGTVAGDRFRLQPEWQAAGGFTVDYPVAPGVRIFATPSVTHRSRIFFEVPNSLRISQEAVTLLNARAGVSFADERFEIAGFIRNATNERYLLDAGNTGGAFGRPTFIPAEPRFYGVQLTARIGR